MDAQWKTIQRNCFTRWTNEHLKKVGKYVVDLESDLSNGLRLIALVEVLSGKSCPKFNKSPNNRTEKFANVTMALKFLRDDEGIKIVNIDSSDIVDHNLKLILGLIWTLIQHYSISMPVWEDEEHRPQEQEQTPNQRLLGWIKGKLPNRPVGNFTTDWNDGKTIGALVNGVAPGFCPDWESWNPENNVENATKAMNAVEEWLGVPQLIQPAEMCNPNIDEMSMMTYLSQFPVLVADTLRRHMELQRPKLNEIIESDFGFLDHLLSKRVIPYCEIEKIRSAQTRYEKIGKLLDYIFNNNKHKDLMSALSQYSHSHVANWIKGNGDYRNEFGSDWPLHEKEHKILDENQSHLIEMIEPFELVVKLYSVIAINRWQREFIGSIKISYEQNVALLDIIRRSSLNVYEKLIKCLEETNQTHMSKVLKGDEAIVTVHATLESDNLEEAETQVVKGLTAILRGMTTTTEQIKRFFEELKLKIIAVTRGGSIVLYTGCCKEEELNHLCQVSENENTKGTLEKLFVSCAPKQTIRVLAVKVSEEDLMKAKKTFALSSKLFQSKVIVFGIDEGIPIKPTKDIIEINLNRPENVSKGQQMPVKMIGASDAAVHRDSIFVTGIGENCDEIWRFNATSSTWKKCASLVQYRRYHSVAFVDHILYVCGGLASSNKSHDEVEAYDTLKDQCTAVGKLAIAVDRFRNCVPFKSSLYIFGGLDVKKQTVNKIQVYDTKLNTCSLLSKPMPRPAHYLQAALWENTVILLGHDSCFTYNFETEVWKVRDRFKTNSFYFGLTISNGLVFVIGGGSRIKDAYGKTKWICRDDVRFVPVVNILNDEPIEWKHHAKLPRPSMVSALGRIDFLLK